MKGPILKVELVKRIPNASVDCKIAPEIEAIRVRTAQKVYGSEREQKVASPMASKVIERKK